MGWLSTSSRELPLCGSGTPVSEDVGCKVRQVDPSFEKDMVCFHSPCSAMDGFNFVMST